MFSLIILVGCPNAKNLLRYAKHAKPRGCQYEHESSLLDRETRLRRQTDRAIAGSGAERKQIPKQVQEAFAIQFVHADISKRLRFSTTLSVTCILYLTAGSKISKHHNLGDSLGHQCLSLVIPVLCVFHFVKQIVRSYILVWSLYQQNIVKYAIYFKMLIFLKFVVD